MSSATNLVREILATCRSAERADGHEGIETSWADVMIIIGDIEAGAAILIGDRLTLWLLFGPHSLSECGLRGGVCASPHSPRTSVTDPDLTETRLA